MAEASTVALHSLYVTAEPPTDMNKNTSWFHYPGVWVFYILILIFAWLISLSLFRCSAGTAWSIVHLVHFMVTYWCFHWKKGTPFGEDQGIYNKLTWWEQMDNGRQLTRNRKFLMVVPVALYMITCHTTNYRSPWIFFNTVAVFVLVIAKLPNMHKMGQSNPSCFCIDGSMKGNIQLEVSFRNAYIVTDPADWASSF